MGFFSDVWDDVGELTGFGGGGKIDPQTVDPTMYKELYEAALAEMQGVGQDPNSLAQKEKIGSSALSMLEELDDNAAGRKKNFMEDMSRGFAADTQNLARAKGGTGNFASAMQPSGAMYDAQARATSRGLNDLYGQAVNDLGNLSGVQQGQQGQEMQRRSGIADTYMNELNSRRGTTAANSDRKWNAGIEQHNRKVGTINGVANFLGDNAKTAATGGVGG